jgi:hypothetical protein
LNSPYFTAWKSNTAIYTISESFSVVISAAALSSCIDSTASATAQVLLDINTYDYNIPGNPQTAQTQSEGTTQAVCSTYNIGVEATTAWTGTLTYTNSVYFLLKNGDSITVSADIRLYTNAYEDGEAYYDLQQGGNNGATDSAWLTAISVS